MRRKIIHFKPGTITLYDKNSDDYFWGRMLVNFRRTITDTVNSINDREVLLEIEMRKNLELNLKNVISENPLPSNERNSSGILIYKKPAESTMSSNPVPANVKLPDSLSGEFNTPLISDNITTPDGISQSPGLIDFKFFYRKIISDWLIPKVKSYSYIYKSNSRETAAGLKNSVYSVLINLEKNRTILDAGAEKVKNKFTFKLNYGFLTKVTFGFTVVSFILLSLYFTSSQIDLLSFASSPKHFSFMNEKRTDPENPEIGFQKPQRQFEPTPDPTPVSREFRITIPKINLISDITPNVDLSDEIIYKKKLYENGVAHALGSYFPGEDGPVYLFAHSTDTLANIPLFNAKFYSLNELELGDRIELSYHGKKYSYSINSKQIIDPLKIDIIQNTSSRLVLQTCWPPGTDWQRLVIFADPVDVPAEL